MNDRPHAMHAMLAALGHASRYRIALCLAEGERCVGDLALAIGLSQSCTTRHVQALERAGVVRARREGKRVLVGLEREREGLDALIGWLTPEAGGLAPRASGPARGRPRRASRSGASGDSPSERPEVPGGAVRRPAVRGTPALPDDPVRAVPASEEAPPREGPASGKPPAPEQAPTVIPHRYRDTLEDFLL